MVDGESEQCEDGAEQLIVQEELQVTLSVVSCDGLVFNSNVIECCFYHSTCFNTASDPLKGVVASGCRSLRSTPCRDVGVFLFAHHEAGELWNTL